MLEEFFSLVPLEHSDDSTFLPGDPRMWKAVFTLNPILENISCTRSTWIACKYAKPLTGGVSVEQILKKSLGWGGGYQLDKVLKVPQTTLQVRRLGFGQSESLATMVWELLRGQGIPIADVWIAKSFQFSDESLELQNMFNKILSFGSASGIFQQGEEETRWIEKEQSLSWPRVNVSTPLTSSQETMDYFSWSISQQYFDVLRCPVRIIEKRYGHPQKLIESENPYKELIYSASLDGKDPSVDSIETSPLSFVLGASGGFEDEAAVQDAYFGARRGAALLDRCIAVMDRRHSPSYQVAAEPFTHFQVNTSPIDWKEGMPKKLFMLGPWDSRNSIQNRRYEYFVQHFRVDQKVLQGLSFFDGATDWLMCLLEQAVKNAEGWEFDRHSGHYFLKANRLKTRQHLVGFFWANDHKQLELLANSVGAQLVCLGEITQSQKCFLADDSGKWLLDVSMKEVLALPSQWSRKPIEYEWTFSPPKATTYGFDRAAMYPDQFLLKMMSRTVPERHWRQVSWNSSSGDRILTVSMRNRHCSPRPSFLWHDGNQLWAEAVGSKEGWSQQDPEAAGLAAVDAAVRELLCIGASPSQGFGSLWIPQPESLPGETKSDAQAAAYFLSVKGAVDALQVFGYKLTGFHSRSISRSKVPPEVHVWLKKATVDGAQQSIPGFRIDGEVLYIVGPKPTFVDSGSKILKFVKVDSNHIFKIQPQLQLELYQKIFSLIQKNVVASSRPIGNGGAVETLAEMALWSGMGAQIRPGVPVIELYSASPGRLVVGVLPQAVKAFEQEIKSEYLTILGTVSGDKIFGMPLNRLRELDFE